MSLKSIYKVQQVCADTRCKLDHPVLQVAANPNECPICDGHVLGGGRLLGAPPDEAEDGQACLFSFVDVHRPTKKIIKELTVVELKPGLTIGEGFIALLSKKEKGWHCKVATEEDLKRHGL